MGKKGGKKGGATKPVKAPGKGGKKRTTFWTEQRVERLINLYSKLRSSEKPYARIAKQMKTTESAVYQKLGRIGQLNTAWSQRRVKVS